MENNIIDKLLEYNIDDIEKVKWHSILISPEGEIYVFVQKKNEKQILKILNKHYIHLEKIISKICKVLYLKGFEVLESDLKNMKYIIVEFFGYTIYQYDYNLYRYPTKIQLEILSKLYNKEIIDITSLKDRRDNKCKQEKYL